MSNNVNSITLGGRTVFDPPKGARRSNRFVMHASASHPGVGEFLMKYQDYLAIRDSVQWLIMKSGVTDAEQAKQTVALEVLVCGYRPQSQDVGDDTDDAVWVVVTDRRAELSTPLAKFYNVQRPGFAAGDFYASTKNGSAEWTWAQVQADLGCSGTWASVPTAWKPRNLIFDSVPTGRIIDDVAGRLRLIVGYDYYNSGSPLPYLLGFLPGVRGSRNQTIIDEGWIQRYELAGAGMSERSPSRQPASYDFVFPAAGSTADDPYASSARAYVKNVATSISGTGPKRVVHVGEYPAVANSGGWANSSELDTIAADLATRLDAEAGCTFSTHIYGGLWPLQCDGEIRGIMWTSDASAARTAVRYGDDRAFNVEEELVRTNRDLANQLVVAYGAGRVGLGSSGTRYVVSSGAGGDSKGTLRYQVHTMVSDLEDGWDYVRISPPEA